VYASDPDQARMFATPRYVVKNGVVVVEEGQLRRAPAGRRLHVCPPFDAAVTRTIRQHFDDHSTVRFANFPVSRLRDAASPLAPVGSPPEGR
jgi:formylmethanofuran dehydrogenase subunit A